MDFPSPQTDPSFDSDYDSDYDSDAESDKTLVDPTEDLHLDGVSTGEFREYCELARSGRYRNMWVRDVRGNTLRVNCSEPQEW